MTAPTRSDVSYDPYDVEIDADPYPVYQRLREEAPLYHNDEHDFYALSRFADVEGGLVDRETYISGRGAILELIKADIEMPPGVLIFEDPPIHTMHRGLLSRVFTPRAHGRTGAQDPEFCAAAPGPAGRRRRVRLRRRPRCADAHAGDRDAARHPRAGPGGHPRPVARRAANQAGQPMEYSTRPDRDRRGLRRVRRLAGRAPLRRPDDRPPARRVRGRDGHHPTPDARGGADLRQRGGGRRQRHHDPVDRLGGQGPRRPPRPTPGAGREPVAGPERHRGAAPVRAPAPTWPAT